MNSPNEAFALTIVDTAGIQDYIFSSNDLKHSLGASWLVHWATHGAVYAALSAATARCNIDATGNVDSELWIERGDVDGELVYVGGGNAVLIFASRNLAVAFARHLTSAVMRRAPGLQVVVAHVGVQWNQSKLEESDSLAAKVKQVIQTVNRRKREREHWHAPLMGLGVTAACQYTGLPATVERRKSPDRPALQLISGQVKAKEDAVFRANQRLRDELGVDVECIENFDEIGDKEEFSYLAVVHTDGNGMGKRVKQIADKHDRPVQNRDYIEAMRAFSASIQTASEAALRSIVDCLEQATDREDKIAGVVARPGGKLPFRPIVFGGDDLTFVCDGRLGISLTQHYMKTIGHIDLWDKNPIHVRAGVAIVKTHLPFSRAYNLAEELAESAKGFLREQPDEVRPNLNAIDWHFATTGVIQDLESIRAREYIAHPFGHLLMRPLLVDAPVEASEWRTWDEFIRGLNEFQDVNGHWAGKRSKLKALREELRQGPEAVKSFMRVYEPGATLPDIGPDPQSRLTGWYLTERCTCYDAIEAYDFYVPLVCGSTKGGNA